MHKTIVRAVLTALLLCIVLNAVHAPAQEPDPAPAPESLSDVEAWIRENMGDKQAEPRQCDNGTCPETATDAPSQDQLFIRGDSPVVLNLVDGSAAVDFGTWQARAEGRAELPADSANPARDKALGQRTAAVEARKNLLQVLLDLPLDGSRTVAQALAGQDDVLAELRGLAQNSRLSTEITEPVSGLDGVCLTRAELDLAGQVAERLVPVAEAFQTGLPFTLDVAPDAVPQAAAPLADAAYRQSLAELGGYTGVVVDARGLGALPALLPRVMDPSGLGVYGPFLASRSVAVNQGMAVYVTGRSDPRLAQRVGTDPLWVRALAVIGQPPCDLVVSTEDGVLVRKIFEKQELRDTGALVILLD